MGYPILKFALSALLIVLISLLAFVWIYPDAKSTETITALAYKVGITLSA